MRILTWNLDHGRFKQDVIELQQRLIESYAADVVVLTEVPQELSVPGPGHVLSPVERAAKHGAEAWIRISGPAIAPVEPSLPFGRLAAAALVTCEGEDLAVYGSVLPWKSAISQTDYLAEPGDTPQALFLRVLGEQVADLRRLRSEHPDRTLIWAGDFNQPLSGPNGGFDNAQREALRSALQDLKLVAWNEHLGHFLEGAHAIDLICGPHDRMATRVERIAPVVDGQPLSDHPAYLVDLT